MKTTEVFSVSLKSELVHRVRDRARILDRSVSSIAKEALEAHLNKGGKTIRKGSKI